MIATNKEIELITQVTSDLDRHEGFREFAYPDPLSKLYQKFPRAGWGKEPAAEILKKIGNATLARAGIDPDEVEEAGHPWTVGYGFTNGVNLNTRMSKTQSKRKLEELVHAVHHDLFATLSWYKDTTMVTKTILINMYYNLGRKGLLGFKNTLRYISERKYANAAANMMKSLWAKQVGRRASELARRLETQEIAAPYKATE